MKFAINKLDGSDPAFFDAVPTSHVECAPRPDGHVLNETWASDPLSPEVCWRLPTQAEIDAEKDAKAVSMADVKNVALAILEAVFDMKQNPGNYPTVASLKQKALQQYRSKL